MNQRSILKVRESFVGKCTLLAILIFSSMGINAQTTVVKDSVEVKGTTVVIPGKHYKRSSLHNAFWGKHYRKEWATPFRVNNFYIDTAYGGLVPTKESGSRQSMGLRLKAKDGKEYVLRSIDKDFGNGFPEIFKGTFIAKIGKDQASWGYPLAAFTVAPMINAAGIYHTNPRLVFVPTQNALGEYNDKYSNQLYLFEERPDEDQHDAPWFGNSKNVVGTDKMYANIFKDNDYSVDQFAFAKARLFDMLIGDWGRHADQWRWASFKTDKKTVYKPIPRDRDQAYTKFDGFFPFIATNIAGAVQLESFSSNIKVMHFFNRPGRQLDLQFANQLAESEWVRAAKELQAVLTDSVIDLGMRQLPPEMYEISGAQLTKYLKARRDHLQDFAHRYYKYLARKIPVYGTDDREYFEVNRLSNKNTEVKVYKINKDGTREDKPLYSRLIYKNQTKDLHLYGFKDDDVFVIKGNGNDGSKVRLIGITKGDKIIDSTNGRDRKTKIFRGKSTQYDSVFQKKMVAGPILLVTPPAYSVFEDDALGLFTRPGLHVGFNIAYHPAPWKKDSLETVHNLAVNWGFARKTFFVDYVGMFPQKIGKWDILLKAKMDAPATENYYGKGNNIKDTIDRASTYYNVFSRRYFAGAGIQRNIRNTHLFDMTLFYQAVKVHQNSDKYIGLKEPSSPVFTDQVYSGVEMGYSYRNVNNDVLPTKGVIFSAGTGYVFDLQNNDNSFLKAISNVAFYIPLGNKFSFATRAGGGVLSGEPNYYHMNKLGGNINLRGFSRDRFYGKKSFYNNNELRFVVPTHNIVFNGKIGLLAFIDNGRVWQPGFDALDDWRVGYGGGLIVVPFNKVALAATVGNSKEGTQVLLKAGMFF